jgi:hypothetical protein
VIAIFDQQLLIQAFALYASTTEGEDTGYKKRKYTSILQLLQRV